MPDDGRAKTYLAIRYDTFFRSDLRAHSQGRPIGGAFIAFSIPVAYTSGDMMGVNVGSVPEAHVKMYMSSAISASVARSTIMKTCRLVGFP